MKPITRITHEPPQPTSTGHRLAEELRDECAMLSLLTRLSDDRQNEPLSKALRAAAMLLRCERTAALESAMQSDAAIARVPAHGRKRITAADRADGGGQ